MVIVRLISGLGNQLFQYAVGRQLSLLNNTALKFDISFFEGQSLRNYKLNKYNVNAGIANNNECTNLFYKHKSLSLYAKLYRKITLNVPKHKKTYFAEDKLWQYENDLYNIRSDVYLEGYWQHYKYLVNINPLILKELTVKDEYYTTEAIQLRSQIEEDESSVSLHIRRGDYVTDKDANNFMGVTPISYYLKAIDFIKERIGNIRVYVFSDDLSWAKINLKCDVPIVFVDAGHDYLELDLMCKCKHNIIANSTYSWWGAFLNNNSSKVVICPKQWIKDPADNERVEIAFPDWVKL